MGVAERLGASQRRQRARHVAGLRPQPRGHQPDAPTRRALAPRRPRAAPPGGFSSRTRASCRYGAAAHGWIAPRWRLLGGAQCVALAYGRLAGAQLASSTAPPPATSTAAPTTTTPAVQARARPRRGRRRAPGPPDRRHDHRCERPAASSSTTAVVEPARTATRRRPRSASADDRWRHPPPLPPQESEQQRKPEQAELRRVSTKRECASRTKRSIEPCCAHQAPYPPAPMPTSGSPEGAPARLPEPGHRFVPRCSGRRLVTVSALG